MIHSCPNGRCKSEFQDDLYGKGRRVFNPCKGAIDSNIYGRCTVCKEEVVVGSRKGEALNAEVRKDKKPDQVPR